MSEQLTTKDYEELQQKSQKILQDLESVDKSEWKKKKELIEEFVITNRILLRANKLPIDHSQQFCSYIVDTLNNRGITVNQNGVFYSLFSDDEKDPRGPKSIDQKSIEISSDLQTASEKVKEVKQKIQDSYTEYLEFSKTTLIQCQEILDDIITKYPEFQEEVKKALGDVGKLMEEEKEFRAAFEDIAKHTDLRNKALEWKKIKALLLEKIEFNIAKVANLIHVSPKHLSANVMRNEQDDLMEKTRWFETLDLELTKDYKKGDTISIKIDEWFDRQVERMKLNLPFKKPEITHIIKS